MRRFNKRKKSNYIFTFLIIDILVLFAMFNISFASYTAQAISDAEMEVALYAFRHELTDEVDGQVVNLDLGSMKPGDTKTFKINVYNSNLSGNKSDTDIIYDLKIITTTNINLNYELYLEGDDGVNYALNKHIVSDEWGTNYNYILGPDRCFKFTNIRSDRYILKVTFPEEFNSAKYQDLIESIKVQLVSRQAFPEDIELLESSGTMCR